MKIAGLLLTVAMLGWSAAAFAHAHLQKAVPADGSTLTAAPPDFVLTFVEPARLTMLALQKDGEAKQKIGPLPTASAKEFSVAAPKLTAGRYVLSWVAVGDDGHVMPGKLTFTVT